MNPTKSSDQMWKMNDGSHSSGSSEPDAKAPSLSLSDDGSEEEEALSLSDDDSEEEALSLSDDDSEDSSSEEPDSSDEGPSHAALMVSGSGCWVRMCLTTLPF